VQELDQLFLTGSVDDLKQVASLKKKTVYPRADVVTVVLAWILEGRHGVLRFAPLEADGQLVHEEMSRRIDAIITTDSDLFVLGARKLVMDLKRSKNTWSCFIVDRSTVLPLLNLEVFGVEAVGRGANLAMGTKLAEFASFLGSDFVPNLSDWGWVKVVQYFSSVWVQLESHQAKLDVLANLARSGTFNQSSITEGYDILQYTSLFETSVASLYSPPHHCCGLFHAGHSQFLGHVSRCVNSVRQFDWTDCGCYSITANDQSYSVSQSPSSLPAHDREDEHTR
jgi:hypothetical protein